MGDRGWARTRGGGGADRDAPRRPRVGCPSDSPRGFGSSDPVGRARGGAPRLRRAAGFAREDLEGLSGPARARWGVALRAGRRGRDGSRDRRPRPGGHRRRRGEHGSTARSLTAGAARQRKRRGGPRRSLRPLPGRGAPPRARRGAPCGRIGDAGGPLERRALRSLRRGDPPRPFRLGRRVGRPDAPRRIGGLAAADRRSPSRDPPGPAGLARSALRLAGRPLVRARGGCPRRLGAHAHRGSR